MNVRKTFLGANARYMTKKMKILSILIIPAIVALTVSAVTGECTDIGGYVLCD